MRYIARTVRKVVYELIKVVFGVISRVGFLSLLEMDGIFLGVKPPSSMAEI